MNITAQIGRPARHRTVLAAFLVAMTLVGTTLAGALEDATTAYGRGDYATAFQLLKPLANAGIAKAQDNLGFMYDTGQGVPQDYVQAHKWYNLAASRFPASESIRRETAIKNRDGVAAKMTPQQIAEAQKLAREWKPTK